MRIVLDQLRHDLNGFRAYAESSAVLPTLRLLRDRHWEWLWPRPTFSVKTEDFASMLGVNYKYLRRFPNDLEAVRWNRGIHPFAAPVIHLMSRFLAEENFVQANILWGRCGLLDSSYVQGVCDNFAEIKHRIASKHAYLFFLRVRAKEEKCVSDVREELMKFCVGEIALRKAPWDRTSIGTVEVGNLESHAELVALAKCLAVAFRERERVFPWLSFNRYEFPHCIIAESREILVENQIIEDKPLFHAEFPKPDDGHVHRDEDDGTGTCVCRLCGRSEPWWPYK